MKFTAKTQYTFYGMCFGLMFPAIATAIELWKNELAWSIDQILLLQSTDPLLWIIDTAPIFLGLFARFGGIQYDHLRESNQKIEEHNRLLTQTNISIERFVPKEMLHYLGKENILTIRLGDCIQRNMSVLFSDIRSFSSRSELMSPEDTFRFVNAYFSYVGPMVRNHQGFVDKYIGDAIMALYDKPDDAVQSAIHMLASITEYNKTRQNPNRLPIKFGIGINTGDVMLGTIGEKNRMESTVIGDTVNLSARMEGLTKIYGATVLISESTFISLAHPNQYAIRVIDKVMVKGKTHPVTVYEAFDGDPAEIRDLKNMNSKKFQEAVALYYLKEFDNAQTLFHECLTQNPEDKACEIYIQRCRHYLKVGWDESWDGVMKFDQK